MKPALWIASVGLLICSSPLFSEDPKLPDAKAYRDRGCRYGEKGEYDKAIADHTEAIRLDPNNADGYCYRGGAHYGKREYDKAITDYTQAIRIDPKHFDAIYNRGVAKCDKEDFGGAIADFNKLIQLNPKSPQAYLGRGAVRLRDDRRCPLLDGRLCPEIFYVGSFVDCLPQPRHMLMPQRMKHLVLVVMAVYKYGQLGQKLMLDDKHYKHDLAIADFTEAIRLDPKCANAYLARASAYFGDDFEKAIADCTEVLRFDPKNTIAYYYRAVIYRLHDESDKAIADYTEAIRIDPRFHSAYLERGFLYGKKGDKASAMRDFRKVKELGHPVHPDLLEHGVFQPHDD